MIPTIVGLLYIMLYPNLCRLLMVIAILISKTTTPTAPPGIPGDFSLCTWEVAIFTDVPSTWTSCRSNSTVLTALQTRRWVGLKTRVPPNLMLYYFLLNIAHLEAILYSIFRHRKIERCVEVLHVSSRGQPPLGGNFGLLIIARSRWQVGGTAPGPLKLHSDNPHQKKHKSRKSEK